MELSVKLKRLFLFHLYGIACLIMRMGNYVIKYLIFDFYVIRQLNKFYFDFC